MSQEPFVIHWFRRDLRLNDNAALYHALKSGYKVMPIFIFDTQILDKLSDRSDLRVNFIYQRLKTLQTELKKLGSDLQIYSGDPSEIWAKLSKTTELKAVFTNRDYEPYAIQRDLKTGQILKENGIEFKHFKDHVILEKGEVLKDDGLPYTVYTPYSKKWKSKLTPFHLKAYPVEKYLHHLLKFEADAFPSIETIGFKSSPFTYPTETVNSSIIKQYHQTRDFPAIQGTSRLSLHFRFGTVSIREKVAKAQILNEKFLNELIWRDFYIQIMAHFPYAMQSAFKPLYNTIEWENDELKFKAWCEGQTGYPIVDAGMRELNTTGHMHNRVRMIVASFLCKHLLIDWRWGEAYFAEKLLDFELACNNGGWQWAAGSGVDAAPYFRIFNPYLQAERFDPEQKYIKTWVPEFGTKDYAKAIVVHEQARERCLRAYKSALELK
ncbi:MAG: deoxyribodipyrimidine photo-lyase [Bacteroidia bacterium]|nr:deoxyribodipyrimidine photo-lyase [Bacteroidia bacterium]